MINIKILKKLFSFKKKRKLFPLLSLPLSLFIRIGKLNYVCT